jgi:class 3 adenylate cyclase
MVVSRCALQMVELRNPAPEVVELVSEPTGTVTFLLTDIEGSTQLLQSHAREYEAMLINQRAIITNVTNSHEGRIVDTAGDSCFAVFATAVDAVLAAVESQRQLAAETWTEGAQFRVRMGLHTGTASAAGDGYVGLDVHRASRIATAAHGGQILASAATVGLLGDTLAPSVSMRRMGSHRLKDLLRSETLFQVVAPGLSDEFPPITTLENRPQGRTSEMPRAPGLKPAAHANRPGRYRQEQAGIAAGGRSTRGV